MTMGDGMPETSRREAPGRPLVEMLSIAERVQELLAPHCERCEIAGSIRRRKAVCGDIELVCIAKPYEVGLFASGVATVLDRWPVIRGRLPGCRYTARSLPEGVQLDVFFARPENWGLIYAIRTGSAEWVHRRLAARWVRLGYKSHEGMLHRVWAPEFEPGLEPAPVREESDLFAMLGLDWVPPEQREVSIGS